MLCINFYFLIITFLRHAGKHTAVTAWECRRDRVRAVLLGSVEKVLRCRTCWWCWLVLFGCSGGSEPAGGATGMCLMGYSGSESLRGAALMDLFKEPRLIQRMKGDLIHRYQNLKEPAPPSLSKKFRCRFAQFERSPTRKT